jgi:hypothetical protein
MAIKDQKKTGSKKAEKISEKKAPKKRSLQKSSGTGKKSEPAKIITGRSSKSEAPEKDLSVVTQPKRKALRKSPAPS